MNFAAFMAFVGGIAGSARTGRNTVADGQGMAEFGLDLWSLVSGAQVRI
jgi:hypothetical protein